MIMILTLAALAAADLALKAYTEHHLNDTDEIPVLKGKLLLRLRHNPGVAMGYMDDKPETVSFLAGAATILTGLVWLFLLPSRGKHVQKTASTLVFAGALSNLSDHIRNDYVVDYLSVNSKNENIRKFVFNLADVFIAAGVILLAVHDLFRKASK